MKHLSIRKKLLLLFYIALATALCIMATSLFFSSQLTKTQVKTAESLMVAGEKEKIKVATDLIATTLSQSLHNAKNLQQEQQLLQSGIQNAFFEKDSTGYFYIYQGTVNVAHPVNPALIGKDLKGTQSSDGIFSVQELNRVAHTGGGFITFTWDKPGSSSPVEKLGYATMIPGTNYWIGSGVYLDDIAQKKLDIQNEVTAHGRRSLLFQAIVAIALLACLLLPMILFISKSILGPIQQTQDAAQKIAAGDFDIHLETARNDEVGELQNSLASMAHSLQSTMQELADKEHEAALQAEDARSAKDHAEEATQQAKHKADTLQLAAHKLAAVIDAVTTASEDIMVQIEQSSRGAHEQALRVDDTAAAMEEMNATVLEVARNATETARAAETSRRIAEEGAGFVKQAVDEIDHVAELSQVLMGNMKKLGKDTESIGDILNVISDIADQTNLLALNAAIEAARAGEAGRGFAVVADEVRKLAEKTMAATRDVASAIQSIQEDTRKHVADTVQSTEKFAHVKEQASISGQSLEKIVTYVSSANNQVQSIAAAAEQQSAASEEISRSISDINQISKETFQAMDSSKNEVLKLKEQVATLHELIEHMNA